MEPSSLNNTSRVDQLFSVNGDKQNSLPFTPVYDRLETMREFSGGICWSVITFFQEIFLHIRAIFRACFYGEPMPLNGRKAEAHFITETLNEWTKDRPDIYVAPMTRKKYLKNFKENVSDMIVGENIKMVFIPVYYHKHYISLVIDKEKKTIAHYDPLRRRGLNPTEIRILKELDLKITKEGGPYTLICNHYFPQVDGWSCGYRMIYFFKQILDGKDMKKIEDHPPSWEERQEIMREYVTFIKAHPEIYS